jgi:hypothetical protein
MTQTEGVSIGTALAFCRLSVLALPPLLLCFRQVDRDRSQLWSLATFHRSGSYS